MEHTTMEHVVLPEAILARSPSQQDGVSAHEERDHRFWGCELIEEAGILLRLPQVVMVTAQTMLQRFYYRKSLRDFDAFRVAIGCLFLAAKVEEQPKRMREVVSVFYAIYRRRKWGKTRMTQQLLEPESDSYYLWCDWLIMVERQILIDLGFSLYTIMEHPHKYILYYIKILDGSKALAQKAWGYLNDSLRVDLCVRYRAEVIACAAIFLASRMLQVKLPMSPPWFELFDVDETALLQASTVIMELYTRKKIVWLDPLTEVNPFAIDDLPDAEPQAVRQSAAVDNVPEKPVDSTRLDDHKPPTSSTSSPSTRTASVSREEASKVSRGSRSGRSESRRSVSRDRGHRRRSRRSSSRSASRRRSRDRRRSRSRSSERHTSSRRRQSPSRSRSRPRRR